MKNYLIDKLPHFFFGALFLGIVGLLAYWWYAANYVIDEQVKVCDVAGKPVVLQKFRKYSANTHWLERNGRRLEPSQIVETSGKNDIMNYYFDSSGEQFTVTWNEQSHSWLIWGVGGDWAKVEGYTFSSTRKIGDTNVWYSDKRGEVRMGDHVFYLVGAALVKARSTEPGPNNAYVLIPRRVKGKYGPYADVTMPAWVEGKPVYVGWTSKVEERGAERITTNAYVFSWNGQDMPINCEMVNAPAKNATDEARRCGADAGASADCDAGAAPKPPVDDATYVKVVDEFDAPVCGGNVKIGLERRVVKRLVAGQDQTSETLMYSINGQRYPIGAEIQKAPNANANLAL